jgi:beta-lactamase class A
MKNVRNKNSIPTWFLYAAIAVLLFMNIFAWWQKEHTINTQSAENAYSFIDPSRRFVAQENLIVNFQSLREEINRGYEHNPDVSMYFEYLPTGANISTNKDAEFYPASLLKVPVAVAVAKKIERGEWKWSNELVLLSGDRDNLFGTLYRAPLNSTHTIEDLVLRSLVESDNTAHFILLRNLETEEVEAVYEHIGLKGFFDTDGRISAKRYSTIFRMLYTSSYLSPAYSQKLLAFMTESAFDDFVEGGLPDKTMFSHKIGIATDKNVFVDSGIVYAGARPYILTVMVKTSDEELAQRIMRDISGKVYSYVKNYVEEDF